MEFIINCVLIFLTTVVVDWMWGKYIIYTSDHRPLPAATFASLLTLTGAFVTISYIHDHRMLFPAALGAFVGTYASVRMNKG